MHKACCGANAARRSLKNSTTKKSSSKRRIVLTATGEIVYEKPLTRRRRSHLMEKQYSCAYCPNRFKNKNEAERHQNSLHLRRHSWSCAALASIESAFHACTTNGGSTDVCGFCGDEFANPADWSARRDHVCHVHKFGECNQGKRFYRADHFRQHLKHSHAGSSGKWTNTLESVCMRDEPPAQPLMERGSMGVSMSHGAPLAIMDSPGIVNSGKSGTGPVGHDFRKVEIIDELPHEH